MSIPDTLTYDIVGAPRRPSVLDVGGAAFLDDQVYPPDPVTMPSAAMENQNERLMVAAHSVLPVVVITLKITAGVPSIESFGCMSTLPTNLTFTVTDNGVGDTSITWPANTFPTPILKPKGGITGATVGMIAVEQITNGIRVRTLNSAAAAADLPWTVDVY